MRKLAPYAAAAGFLFLVIAMITRPADAWRPTNRAIVPYNAELLFGSITATTGPTGNNTLATLPRDCGEITFVNTTTKEIQTTVNGSQWARVPASSVLQFSPGAMDARIPYGTIVGVYATSGALPTSGAFSLVCE